MQTSTQSEGVAAAVAQVPATITVPGAGGKSQVLQVPKTDAEVFALVDRRTELASQLSSVTERRQQLSQEIATAPEGASRTGLEDRIRVLDQRIVQLESDLAVTGVQLAGAPGDMVAIAERRGNPPSGGDFEEGMFMGGSMIVAFFAVVYAWRRFRGRKKRKTQTPATALTSDSTDRLERLERGMESIAIEIERVSEGQRFVTKLLSESATPMGVSHRIAQPEQQPVRSTPAPTL